MKGFFDAGAAPVSAPFPGPHPAARGLDVPVEPLARIAVYDSLVAAPRVEDVTSTDAGLFIETLAARVYQVARDQGGRIPYTLIREIVENFLHACFAEVTVTVMDDGNTIRFSDQGPGIPDKEKAFLPGFSTATAPMKRVIRGVGSGLPIVKECLSFSDGDIEVDDNLGAGTVVTLRVQPPTGDVPSIRVESPAEDDIEHSPRLSVRQKQVLSLVMELGAVGPSRVSKELGVALSTAHRDLAFLEDLGLIATDGGGKRALTEDGVALLDDILK